MKNLSICKKLVKTLIKEVNDFYECTDAFETYALTYNEDEKFIIIYPMYDVDFYSPERFVDAANACACSWFIGSYFSSDGKNKVSIHIF